MCISQYNETIKTHNNVNWNWIEHSTDAWVSKIVLAITCTQLNRDIGGILTGMCLIYDVDKKS